jgi:hypothetical protein
VTSGDCSEEDGNVIFFGGLQVRHCPTRVCKYKPWNPHPVRTKRWDIFESSHETMKAMKQVRGAGGKLKHRYQGIGVRGWKLPQEPLWGDPRMNSNGRPQADKIGDRSPFGFAQGRQGTGYSREDRPKATGNRPQRAEKGNPQRVSGSTRQGAAGFTGCAFVFSVMALIVILAIAPRSAAQTELAGVYGRVTDPSGAVIVDAEVEIRNVETNVSTTVKTNSDGLYTIPSLHPGHYLINVRRPGFKSVTVTELTLNVQDNVVRNFALQVGSVSETVTITADDLHINTTDASVSTVVDRQFAENLPMNGRSFQSLIELTPGVVLTANNGVDTGQFSINGQRANANYWTVDGASANIGISAGATAGSGLAGTLGSTSVFGGTNSLVSVDALQEFRIQTSTYAPEFGRTPGGQISIVTRSGTNRFHGTAFDYLRNDLFDANDWFANSKGLPKPRERQNDFGGTFSGPIIKDKTFFFFSYEGLRLRLPQTALTTVPCDSTCTVFGDARAMANAELQPYFNAYPRPNGPEDFDPCDPVNDPTCPPTGLRPRGSADFNASYSNPGTLDAYSLRMDHRLNDKLSLFGRYNYSPSELTPRGPVPLSLSTVVPTTVKTQTGTLGLTWAISPVAVNDFRFNYSSTDASSSTRLDNFGGAVPLRTLPFPSPFTARNGNFGFTVLALGQNSGLLAGANTHNRQRQINIVDNVSVQKSSHSLKFGVDYRRLSPRLDPSAYQQQNFFLDMPSAETGASLFNEIASSLPVTFLFRNLGVFAQDTWHIRPRLTMTYGLRWDVDFVPASINGPEFNAVTGFDLSNLSNLALLPTGTRPYRTRWGNLAPRIGLAYRVSENQGWQTVLRGGFGVFYDLASSEAGNGISIFDYPFGSLAFTSANFPLSSANAAPAPIAPPNASNQLTLFAVDPHLESPYTLQWNVALEQALGRQQTLSVSYVGGAGRRLIQTALVRFPNPNLAGAELVTNAGTSDYDALQLQFQRRLSRGLQALASYSWSHSLDSASAGSVGNLAIGASNALSALHSNVNRGSSDFDVRNAFSLALTYDVPVPMGNAFAKAILRGWSTENIVQGRSASPVDVFYGVFATLANNGFITSPRPDVVAGQPFYLYGPQYPGGKAFNPAAFMFPPLNPSGCVPGVDFPCLPTRQGNLPRNTLRGFGAAQWDFAVHRDFLLHESVKLQFRAEMFNVLNHPNFGPPDGNLNDPQFGQSTSMLGRSLNGAGLGSGSGGFDPLYQLGGPRSIQLALKLFF